MEKEKLVDTYRHLVVSAATRCFVRFKQNGSVSLEDMIGMGYVGLLEAANKFNENQNSKFATFAFNRIRGNILDETNRFLGLEKMKKYGISMINMNNEQLEEQPDPRAENSVNEIYKKEILSYIDYAIDRFLTRREKEAINLKYKSGMKDVQIAEHMGITKQRVKTLLSVAIDKLKKRINLDARQKIHA